MSILILLQEKTIQDGLLPETTTRGGLVLLSLIFALIFFIIIGVGLLVRVGTKTLPQQVKGSWLDYGNFYIVAFGIAAVLIGFLVVLLFHTTFKDTAQALGFMAALFGVITGLVGTFFGVKQSADAREGAQELARAAGVRNTAPTITIVPSNETKSVGNPHKVTATVTSVDGSPAANASVTFTITSGPDVNTTSTVKTADTSGNATFELTNNGTAGTDTIEVTYSGGTRTAMVTFREPRPWRRR